MFGSSFGMMLFLFHILFMEPMILILVTCIVMEMKLAVCTAHGTIVTDSSLLMRDIEHVTETTDTTVSKCSLYMFLH